MQAGRQPRDFAPHRVAMHRAAADRLVKHLGRQLERFLGLRFVGARRDSFRGGLGQRAGTCPNNAVALSALETLPMTLLGRRMNWNMRHNQSVVTVDEHRGNSSAPSPVLSRERLGEGSGLQPRCRHCQGLRFAASRISSSTFHPLIVKPVMFAASMLTLARLTLVSFASARFALLIVAPCSFTSVNFARDRSTPSNSVWSFWIFHPLIVSPVMFASSMLALARLTLVSFASARFALLIVPPCSFTSMNFARDRSTPSNSASPSAQSLNLALRKFSPLNCLPSLIGRSVGQLLSSLHSIARRSLTASSPLDRGRAPLRCVQLRRSASRTYRMLRAESARRL